MRFAFLVAGLGLAPLAAGAAEAPDMTAEPTAVIQGLDKITARVSRFDAPVGAPATFGTLSIVVRDCEKSAPEERPENAAFIEIYENRPGQEKARLFGGWMFSSSPALSALEHPVYDINLLECKGARVAAPTPPPAPAATSAAAKPAGKSRTNTARPPSAPPSNR
jgi:hypothetical protein